MIILRKFSDYIYNFSWLTKYVVGAKANPPKNPKRPPKKGMVIAMNIVNAEKFENTQNQRK
jgi:hypothetical protein